MNSAYGLIPLLMLCGCGGGAAPSSDSSNASAAVDSTNNTSTESALLMASTDATVPSMSAGSAASAAAASAKSWYQPASCVTATAVGESVTYVLVDCTGPWGLVHTSGTVVVTYSVDAAGLHASVSASALNVNGAVVDIGAQGTYSVSGTTKKLVVTTNGAGTGPLGNQVARQGSYTVTWNSASMCATLDGSWSTQIGTAVWSTAVSGFEQCKGACPAQGTIAHTGGLSHVTITVTFDGSAVAKWSTSSGASGTVNLLCGG
jgi:hypothetical protein